MLTLRDDLRARGVNDPVLTHIEQTAQQLGQ
jgi:hypothetical protein